MNRSQVLRMLQAGRSYEEIGRTLGIRPGLAYLIATGLPADGSDAPAAGDVPRAGALQSSQRLANPGTVENPTSSTSVREWIKRQVSLDHAMQSAESARDAVPAPAEEPDRQHDVIDELVRDHNQVKAMLEQLSAIPSRTTGASSAQMSARKSIVDMITAALSQHESLEEEYLWPAVRKTLPDGEQRSETALQQEKEGEDVLTALGRLDADDERFDGLVEKLTLLARKHVAYEERVFMDLERQMPVKQRRKIGRRIHRSRALSPTRPHPHAPQHSAAVKAAGLPAATLDKLRDRVAERPADRRGRADDDAGTLESSNEQS